MRISLKQQKDLHFIAENSSGQQSHIDLHEVGMRPMEHLLSALASCAAFDVVEILKKQRQDLRNLTIEANGERPKDEVPKPFRKIHLVFKVYGSVEEKKAKRAVSLAVEKYCSVGASLDPTIEVGFEVQLFE